MAQELLPCPFCGCAVEVKSNRDWHRISGNHTEECLFHECVDFVMVPATDDQRVLAVAAWNTRSNG